MVCTQENPDGPITNSDLELAGLLICWLVMEEVSPCLCHKPFRLYCNNSTAVSWVKRMATRSPKIAGPLLMALAIRVKARQSSPLYPLHISGAKDGIGDIPARSFGGTMEWHCRTDKEFFTLFNSKSSLSNKNSWAPYRIPNITYMRVISVLRMQGTGMDVWRQLPEQKKTPSRLD